LKSETTRPCVTTSKPGARQRSFCHFDFGHLVLFRISYFVFRICAFYEETTHIPLWGVSSKKPPPLGVDYLLSIIQATTSGTRGNSLTTIRDRSYGYCFSAYYAPSSLYTLSKFWHTGPLSFPAVLTQALRSFLCWRS